ncbi:protein lin-10-like [Corticium candelabrum]|uniref:protein lin-10-like n=1 Tax=Corticium candelabrum TaxID=121492 RepID=UPI002E275E1A|nr:protein lin-10-like [Corticium candelabrum]
MAEEQGEISPQAKDNETHETDEKREETKQLEREEVFDDDKEVVVEDDRTEGEDMETETNHDIREVKSESQNVEDPDVEAASYSKLQHVSNSQEVQTEVKEESPLQEDINSEETVEKGMDSEHERSEMSGDSMKGSGHGDDDVRHEDEVELQAGKVVEGDDSKGIERQELELKIQQNETHEVVDEERAISPNRRKLLVKSSLSDEIKENESQTPEEADQINSYQQAVPTARLVTSALDELTTEDFITGVLFDAKYLGSTQMFSSQPASKSVRMTQAHEAVSRVKQPEGESQPRADIYVLVSTQKITVINALDNCPLMEHPLRTISYIADIGSILVLMARRKSHSQRSQTSMSTEGDSNASTPTTPAGPPAAPTVDTFTPQSPLPPGGGIGSHSPHTVQQFAADNGGTPPESPVAGAQATTPVRQTRIICHVLESENARMISKAIGRAFDVAYHEFLRTHGIEEEGLAHSDYIDVLSVQKMPLEDLNLFSDKKAEREVVIEKKKNEILGLMLMESGWGSMVPTAVIAHMAKNGPAAKTSCLNIGDQITSLNGHSLVGLSLERCSNIVKDCRSLQQVKLTIIPCPPVVQVMMIRPDVKYSLGFSVQNGTIVSILRGSIAERGGVRVGHRIIDINGQSTVDLPHEKIIEILATAIGEIKMKTMPTFLYRLITGQELPQYI